jgi:YbbR domain-containing protein
MRDILASALNRGNLIRLIISVVLALILWGWINTIEDPRQSRSFENLTVTSQGLANDLVLTTNIPPASVALEGPRSAVTPLVPSRIVPKIDLTSISEPGVYTLPIEIVHIDNLWDVEVAPAQIQVTIERRVSRTVALQPEITGEIGSNRQINEIRTAVTQVTVVGSESAVARVVLVALPINVGTQTRMFTENFQPQARDAQGNVVENVTIDPGTISVTVDISQRGKEVAVIPQYIGVPAEGYRVTGQVSNPLTVVVDGPADWLDDVVAVQTEAIDITGATESIRQTVAIIDLPPGAQVFNPTDGRVNVQISIVADGVRQDVPGLTVDAINTAGQTVQIEPADIDVTIFGSAPALAQLTSGDIDVHVDVEGLGPGVYQMVPEVLLPEGLTWVASDPGVVTVTITDRSGDEPSPVGSPSPVP